MLGCLILYLGCSRLCQRVLSWSMSSKLNGCAWLFSQHVHHAFFWSLLACPGLIVDAECVMCWAVLRFSWLFYAIVGELFQLVLSCFKQLKLFTV